MQVHIVGWYYNTDSAKFPITIQGDFLISTEIISHLILNLFWDLPTVDKSLVFWLEGEVNDSQSDLVNTPGSGTGHRIFYSLYLGDLEAMPLQAWTCTQEV